MPPPYESFLASLDPPFTDDPTLAQLGPDFHDQLKTTSRLWFHAGYAPGIAAYLNFFLLADFITTHDAALPARFMTFRSMAQSFYRTDLFIRDVTDSGPTPTGGISNPDVRNTLRAIMRRHDRLHIPQWMMTYFGFQLLEAVEHVCATLSDRDKARHLAYMTTTYRVMGVGFSNDRDLLQRFARLVEARHAAPSPNLHKHARHILTLGEMVGVRSAPHAVAPLLPHATRQVFLQIQRQVRPRPLTRLACRAIGRFAVKKAVGRPRVPQPWPDHTG